MAGLRIINLQFALVMILSCSSNSQNQNLIKLKDVINQFDLQVTMVSCKDCEPIGNLGYRVTYMPEGVEKDFHAIDTLKSLDFGCWMMLLNDESSNWKTNLLLYHLHKRDALLIAGMTEEEWKSSKLKIEDIEYWGNFLKP